MATRAEHRRDTLLRLGDAAISLFETDGPSVTIDQIAAQAEMSRRTVFRWVESKEQLAFVHPMLWFDVFDAALAQIGNDSTVSLEDRFRFASGAIADHIDADPAPPRRAFFVAITHPELQRGFNIVFQQWVDRVAAEVLTVSAQRPAGTSGGAGSPGEAHLRSRVIGASVMGMVDAVTREWLLSPPGTRFGDLYGKGFDVISPLFVSNGEVS